MTEDDQDTAGVAAGEATSGEDTVAAGSEQADRTHGEVEGDTVSVRQGAIGSARGREISVVQGAVGLARGDEIELAQGMLGTALGGEIRARQSFVRLAAARDSVHLEQSVAWNVIANHAHVSPRSFVVFLAARTVDGDVRAVFDWRGALAFGAAVAVVRSMLRLGRKR